MRIEVKGRHVTVSDDLRDHVARRFQVISKQVSDLAELEVELRHEQNRSLEDSLVAEATLHLKGVTLRAQSHSHDVKHAINLVSQEMEVQVKRVREKRRHRRDARDASLIPNPEAATE
jgi:putative sigma-54 modulation protein